MERNAAAKRHKKSNNENELQPKPHTFSLLHQQ
jgi:hypothetical protein